MSLKAHPQHGGTTARLMVFQCVICKTSEAHGRNFKGAQKDLEKEVYFMPYSDVNVKLLKGLHTCIEKCLGFQKRKNLPWSGAGVRSCMWFTASTAPRV